MNRLMMLAALGSLTLAAGCASTGSPKATAASGAATAPAATTTAPAAAAPSSAAAGGGGGCAGSWTIEFQTPMGNQKVPMKLTQSGEQLTGKASDPMSGDELDVKGTCKGDAMTLSQTAESPMGPIELNFAGKMTGKNVAGTVKFGNLGEGEFIGTKE